MRLFYEDEYDAYTSMIATSGKTQKEIALHLWPHMKANSAITKIQTKLDRNGDEKFYFGEVLALMAFCGAYDPLMYACDDTLHSRPDRKSPEDHEQRLVSAVEGAAHTLQRAMQEINTFRRVRGVA